MLFDERHETWSAANVARLHGRFNENPLEGDGGGGNFLSKWDIQLHDADDDVRLLAAELVLVHFLFASSLNRGGKQHIIDHTLAPPFRSLRGSDMTVHAFGARTQVTTPTA